MPGRRILVLTDLPQSSFCRNLGVLYPQQVTVKDFTSEEVELTGFDFIITQVVKGRNVSKLDFDALYSFAEEGGQVICCLYEYACHNGLHFSKTYIEGPERPMIRIKVKSDITRGFSPGNLIPWHGQVSHGIENSPNQFWQRQILDLREREDLRVIATSTVNGGAVIIEERVGRGRIIAIDLLSLPEPFFDSIGSTNKYLFVGNIIGGSVQYGKHFPKKLSYEEFMGEMERLSGEVPSVRLIEEGEASDGNPILSLNVGEEGQPSFLFTGCIHGWEWEAPYGLLRLAELLGNDPSLEGLPPGGYFVKIVPILNPYGYERNVRQNANGVDLNRNFDFGWEEYESLEDVSVPWDFDYKGPSPASEPETRTIQGIFKRHSFVATVDFHTAHFAWEVAFPCDETLVKGIHKEVKRRLKDRFICHQHGTSAGEYIQVNLDRVIELKGPAPQLVSYSAMRGTRAPILVELSGNCSDVHGLVMNAEVVVQVCMAAMTVPLRASTT